MAFCIEPEKLYKRDPKLNPEDVKFLQEWLKKQPHLPVLEESQVAVFLHSCYYRIELAKKTIDFYFTRKTHYPEIFNYPSAEVLQKALSTGFAHVLPKKTDEKYIISFFKLRDYKVENYNFVNMCSLASQINTLYWFKKGISEGVIVLIDLKGITLGHIAKVNLTTAKHAIEHFQEGIPIRLKQIHMINAVPFMDKIMGIIKLFTTSEIMKMIHIHSSVKTLYKYVSKDCLPEDYGGDLSSCQILHEDTVKSLSENADFLKWHDSQKVDETKRVEKSKLTENDFGVEGTFKKLAID